MANLLNRFNKTVAGSESKYSDYISTISSTGDFKRIEGIEVILNSWNNILLTPRRTYMYDPRYGSDLYKLIFEPADSRTIEKIKDEVINSIRTYDDRASINNVRVTFLSNQKGFDIGIDVDYNGDIGQFNVTITENFYFRFFEKTD